MHDFVNPVERLAVVRLLEFLSERTPWYRSLWGIGVVLAMEELYEACTAMRQGHLSEVAVKRMGASLQRRVGRDPAFTDAEKQFFQRQISQVPRPDGVAHFGIRELSERVALDYVERTGRAVDAGRFTVEHFARGIAAHLLDAGFSAKYLHGFIKTWLDGASSPSLPQLCDALQREVASSPVREFEVLLAFATAPARPNAVSGSWLSGAAVTGWLQQHGFDTAGVRSPAATILKVHARDAMGAAQAARNEADRFASRTLIATGKPLKRIPMLWVRGSDAPEPMEGARRGVSVKELLRGDRVFSSDASNSVDAALELMAHLEESSPPAAIAGGWAAIEGLLADPHDRASAADNLAALVTCSFPRAELTALSYRAQQHHPDHCADLAEASTNRERCHILASMMIDQRLPQMPRISDQAAVDRLTKLFRDPGPELLTIREAIGESFHRLYRQRNLILHGARLDSVALTASLRTAAKLAGAGMDRITHGHYVQHRRPRELVARANLAIALVSRESPLACVDLLEDD
ncbi:MAG TPA: integrase [Castellaniella sp.]|nr:integrase [Castellaniella sp.]